MALSSALSHPPTPRPVSAGHVAGVADKTLTDAEIRALQKGVPANANVHFKGDANQQPIPEEMLKDAGKFGASSENQLKAANENTPVTQGAGSMASSAAPASAAEARIQSFEKTSSRLMIPMQLEFFGGILGAMLIPIAKKIAGARGEAAMHAFFSAPAEMLHKTPFGHLLRAPAHYVKAFGEHAEAADATAVANGKKSSGWGVAATNRAAKMEAGAIRMETALADRLRPVGASIGRGLDGLETNAAGTATKNMLNRAAQSQMARVARSHEKVIDKAMHALTIEGKGFPEKQIAWVKSLFGKPMAKVEAGVLAPVMEDIKAGASLTGAAKAAHLNGVIDSIKGMALEGEAAHRAESVMGHLKRAAAKAEAIEHWGSAANGSLKTIVSTASKALARVPVFSALLVTGALAAMGATWLSSRLASKRTAETRAQLQAELGDSQSGFAQAVRGNVVQQKALETANTGVRLASDALNTAFWAMPNMGGVAMAMTQVAPALSFIMPSANSAAFEAYTALQKPETLDAKQKLEAMRHLVAAVPDVAKNEGYYSILGHEVAKHYVQAMDNGTMSLHAIMQELNNPQAFMQRALAVKTETEAKAKAAVSSAEAAVEATGDTPPTKIIAGAEARHDGTIHTQQRQVG